MARFNKVMGERKDSFEKLRRYEEEQKNAASTFQDDEYLALIQQQQE